MFLENKTAVAKWPAPISLYHVPLIYFPLYEPFKYRSNRKTPISVSTACSEESPHEWDHDNFIFVPKNQEYFKTKFTNIITIMQISLFTFSYFYALLEQN